MLIETFGVVGNSDRPSFVRVELRIERGFLFRLSGLSTTAAKAAIEIRSAHCLWNRWPGGISVNIAPAMAEHCDDLPQHCLLALRALCSRQ